MLAISLLLALVLAAPNPTRPPLPTQFDWQGVSWAIAYNNLACGRESIGCTVFAAHLILIHRDLPLAETEDTYSEPEILFHELEHVVTGKEFPRKKLTGHEAIRRLQPMAELLGENPQLAAYFNECFTTMQTGRAASKSPRKEHP